MYCISCKLKDQTRNSNDLPKMQSKLSTRTRSHWTRFDHTNHISASKQYSELKATYPLLSARIRFWRIRMLMIRAGILLPRLLTLTCISGLLQDRLDHTILICGPPLTLVDDLTQWAVLKEALLVLHQKIYYHIGELWSAEELPQPVRVHHLFPVFSMCSFHASAGVVNWSVEHALLHRTFMSPGEENVCSLGFIRFFSFSLAKFLDWVVIELQTLVLVLSDPVLEKSRLVTNNARPGEKGLPAADSSTNTKEPMQIFADEELDFELSPTSYDC